MPIQNEVLKMLASGTIAAGLYSRSPAGQLKGEIRQAKLKYKNEAEHGQMINEQALGEKEDAVATPLFEQVGKQAYAASEDYYDLAQRAKGSKQTQLLAKSYEAADRAAGYAWALSEQQRTLLAARAAVMGEEQYSDIRAMINSSVDLNKPKEKPKAEEKK